MGSVAAPGRADEVTAELAAVLARLSALASGPDDGDEVGDAERIDRIAVLEQIRAALAAAQHTQMVRFARSQVEAQIADDILDPKTVGRGIGDQVALACRVSPFTGSRRLETARVLHADLPGVRGLLAAGRISEDAAAQVVTETGHLDPEQRRRVDAQLCAGSIEELSTRQAGALARRCAYAADPAGYVNRGRTARADRRVTLRPAPDTMSLLTGFLPVEQGVACLAALRRHTDALIATGDSRGRGQIMADTLVERLTGQARAGDVNVEVGIVMPLSSLVATTDSGISHGADNGADDGTDDGTDKGPAYGRDAGPAANPDSGVGCAEVVGHGPIPAGIARDLLANTLGKRWWRRLFTMPEGGALVGGDPRRRAFDGVLAMLIGIRDGGRCRDPFCDAPHPPRRPHPPPPGRWPHQPGQRARGLRPRQLRPRDARLARRARRRRPGPTSSHRPYHHPDRAHLHQPRRARPLTDTPRVHAGRTGAPGGPDQAPLRPAELRGNFDHGLGRLLTGITTS